MSEKEMRFMASLTSAINIQVDSETKKKATDILNDLGLSMSAAINIFLRQVIKKDGLPFEVVNPKPSMELMEALQEGEDIINGKVEAKGYHDVHQMFGDILNESDNGKC